jgi:membrane associated rhomboid family serine protease
LPAIATLRHVFEPCFNGRVVTDFPILPETSPAPRQPFLSVPPATALICGLITAIFWPSALFPAFSEQIFNAGAFVPAATHSAPFAWARLLSYGLLHATPLHWGINTLSLLAFGSGIERSWGWKWLLALLLAGCVIGGAAYWALYPTSPIPLVGLSGGISALFGALLPGLTLRKGDSARRFLGPAWVFILSNVAIGLIGVPGTPGLAIAWQAHIAGFLTGALIGLRRLKKQNTISDSHSDPHNDPGA